MHAPEDHDTAAPEVATRRRARPRRGRLGWAATIGMAGLLLAAWGFVNDHYVRHMWPGLFIDSVLLSRHTEVLVIAVFGLWRVIVEKNAATRRRVATLVVLVTLLWGFVPLLWPFDEPYIGASPFVPAFPGVHVPGAVTWFVWLGLIFLFGRRVDCSWCCPCVGIRETAGQPFRERTLRGPTAWALRHVKWVFLALHVVYFVLLFVPGTASEAFFAFFWMWVPLAYYASFFVVPWTGSRNYCRYLCPFGATYGVVSKAGFFRIEADAASCRGCAKCDQVCDMGVPVASLVKSEGVIDVADCVGCGRCADACPRDVLKLKDVRDTLGLRLPDVRPGIDLVR